MKSVLNNAEMIADSFSMQSFIKMKILGRMKTDCFSSYLSQTQKKTETLVEVSILEEESKVSADELSRRLLYICLISSCKMTSYRLYLCCVEILHKL